MKEKYIKFKLLSIEGTYKLNKTWQKWFKRMRNHGTCVYCEYTETLYKINISFYSTIKRLIRKGLLLWMKHTMLIWEDWIGWRP